MIDQAVIPDLGGLTDDDAHAVVNDQAAADGGAGVNLDPGAAAAALGDGPSQKFQIMPVTPVGQAMAVDSLDAGVQQQNFQPAAGRRVPGLVGGNGFFQIVKHKNIVLSLQFQYMSQTGKGRHRHRAVRHIPNESASNSNSHENAGIYEV